jgi:Glutathione peroxidase
VFDVPGDQPLDATGVVVDEPALVEERPYVLPAAVVEEQIVALGEHDRVVRLDRDRVRDRLLEVPVERRRVDRRVGLVADAAQQCDVAADVERVGCSLAIRAPQTLELALREVEPVHRHRDVRRRRCHQPLGERRLAGAGVSHDSDDAARRWHRLMMACRGTLRRMSSIHELSMTSITGEQVEFDRFRGQVLLVVNVASA